MYKYHSDFEDFLNEYLNKNPQEKAKRLKNRKVLWDVNLNPEEQKGFQDSETVRRPYMYQSYECE